MNKRNNKGFSLAEMLMAILILLLATGLIAAGIPSAIRTYRKVMDTVDGQIFMSTTMTCLRDELDSARDIEIKDNTIKYIDANGFSCTMKLITEDDESNDEKGIFIVRKNPFKTGASYVGVNGAYSNEEVDIPLVSKSAADYRFYAQFSSVTKSGSTITFANLKTIDSSAGKKEIIDVGDYMVLIINES